MKLSMWILADWLEKYKPSVSISDGQPVLSGARLFSAENPDLNESFIYVGSASDISPGEFCEKKVLCINKQDWMMFDHENIESVLNDILEAFDFYNKWETSLKETAYSRESFQALLDLSESVFKNPVFIVDWRGKVLAITYNYKPTTAKDIWDYLILRGHAPAYAYGRLKEYPEQLTVYDSGKETAILFFPEYNHRIIHFNIRFKKEAFIYCNIIENDTRLTQGLKQLADTLKLAISIMIRSSNAPVEVRPASMLFSDILSGKKSDNDSLSWVQLTLGWEHTEKWYIVSFHSLYPERFSGPALLQLLDHHIPQGFCFAWENYFLMLVDCKEWLNVLDILCSLLKDGGFRCGVSTAFSNLDDLPVRLKHAEIAIKYSKEQNTVSMCADYAWGYLFNELTESIRSEMMIHPALELLWEHDHNNGSELARTLYEYLCNERNANQTAKVLFLHRNSLRYRLGRINELINADLDNPNVRMHIVFSYQVKELLGQLNHDSAALTRV